MTTTDFITALFYEIDEQALITASATLDPFDPSPLHVAAD